MPVHAPASHWSGPGQPLKARPSGERSSALLPPLHFKQGLLDFSGKKAEGHSVQTPALLAQGAAWSLPLQPSGSPSERGGTLGPLHLLPIHRERAHTEASTRSPGVSLDFLEESNEVKDAGHQASGMCQRRACPARALAAREEACVSRLDGQAAGPFLSALRVLDQDPHLHAAAPSHIESDRKTDKSNAHSKKRQSGGRETQARLPGRAAGSAAGQGWGERPWAAETSWSCLLEATVWQTWPSPGPDKTSVKSQKQQKDGNGLEGAGFSGVLCF